jgi:hypothetical protein
MDFREIFGVAQFLTFATKSALTGHSRAVNELVHINGPMTWVCRPAHAANSLDEINWT